MTPQEEEELRRSIEASQKRPGLSALEQRAFGEQRAPEEVAQDHEIASQVGVPAPAVPSQRETYQRLARTLDASRRTRETPRLQAWLAEGDNYALAQNDLDLLGRIETYAQSMRDAFDPKSGLSAGERVSRVLFPVNRQTTVPEDVQRGIDQTISSYRAGEAQMRIARRLEDELTGLNDRGEMSVDVGLYRTMQERDRLRREGLQGDAGEVVETIPNFLGVFPAMAQGVINTETDLFKDYERQFREEYAKDPAGTVVGAAATAPLQMLIGVGGIPAGFIEGKNRYTYRLEAGSAYETMVGMKTVDGQPIRPEIAARAARDYGMIAAGIENMDFVLIGSLVKHTLESAGLKLSSPMAKRMVMAMALRRYGVEVLKQGASEGVEEGSQALAEILMRERAKADDGRRFEALDLGQAAAEIGQSVKIGAIFGGAVGGVASIPSLALDLDAVAATERNQEAFRQFVERAQSAQLARLSPEAMESALNAVTANTPIEDVSINVDAFTEYFQSKGLDPMRAAAELGVTPEQYDAAYKAHGELRFKTGTVQQRMIPTPHYAALADHIRVGDSLTPAEMKMQTAIFQNTLETALKKTASTAETIEAARKVGDIMREKFARAAEEGGPRPEYADRVASLWQALFQTLATHIQQSPELSARLGTNAEEIFSKFGFDVRGVGRANDPVDFRTVRGDTTENPFRWNDEAPQPREDAYDDLGDGLVEQPNYLDRARQAMDEMGDAAEPTPGREVLEGIPDDRLIEPLALAMAAKLRGEFDAQLVMDEILGQAEDMLYVEQAAEERASEIIDEDEMADDAEASLADDEELRAEVMDRLENLPPDVPFNAIPDGVIVGVAFPKGEALLTLRKPTEDGEIATSWGQTLYYTAGEHVILGEAEGDPRPVRRDIFEATYEQAEDGRWRKRHDVPVGFWTAEEDGVINAIEGPEPYKAGDVILIGVLGEMWPTKAASFEANNTIVVEEDYEDRASEVFHAITTSGKVSSAPRRVYDTETIGRVNPEHTIIIQSPRHSDLMKMTRFTRQVWGESAPGIVRFMEDDEGNLYASPAAGMLHDRMVDVLKQHGVNVSYNSVHGFIIRSGDTLYWANVEYGPMKGTLLEDRVEVEFAKRNKLSELFQSPADASAATKEADVPMATARALRYMALAQGGANNAAVYRQMAAEFNMTIGSVKATLSTLRGRIRKAEEDGTLDDLGQELSMSAEDMKRFAAPQQRGRSPEGEARRLKAVRARVERRRASGSPSGYALRKNIEISTRDTREIVLRFTDYSAQGMSRAEAFAQLELDGGWAEGVANKVVSQQRSALQKRIDREGLEAVAASLTLTPDILDAYMERRTAGAKRNEEEGRIIELSMQGVKPAVIAERLRQPVESVRNTVSLIRRVQKLKMMGRSIEEIVALTKLSRGRVEEYYAIPYIGLGSRSRFGWGDTVAEQRQTGENIRARLYELFDADPLALMKEHQARLRAEGFPPVDLGTLRRYVRNRYLGGDNGNGRFPGGAGTDASGASGSGAVGGPGAVGGASPAAEAPVPGQVASRTDPAEDIAVAGGFRRRGLGALQLDPASPWRTPVAQGDALADNSATLPLSEEERAARHSLFASILADTSLETQTDARAYTPGQAFAHPVKGWVQVPAGRTVPAETRRYSLAVPLRAHRSWDVAFSSEATYLEVEIIGKMAVIHGAATHPALRGGGVGTQLYRDVIDALLAEGKQVFSDQSVSDDAMRVYERLRQDGYSVKRVGNGALSKLTVIRGYSPQNTTQDGASIYEVAGKRDADEVFQTNSLRTANAKVAEDLIAQGVLLTDFKTPELDDQFRYRRAASLRDAPVAVYTLPSTRQTAKMEVTVTEAPASISAANRGYHGLATINMEYAGSTESGRRGRAKGSAADALRVFSLLYSIFMYDMRERNARGYVFTGATPELSRFYAYTMSKIDFPGYTLYYAPQADTFFFMRNGEALPDAYAGVKPLRPDALGEVYQDIFYSALERALEALKVKEATAAEWRKLIVSPAEVKRSVQRGPDNKPMMDAEGKPVMTERVIPESVRLPGVKRDEIDWTGLLDLLDFMSESPQMAPVKLSKDQLVDFVRQRGVNVEVHGEDETTGDAVDFDTWRDENEDAIYEREREIIDQQFDEDYSAPDLEVVQGSSDVRDVRDSIAYYQRQIESTEYTIRNMLAGRGMWDREDIERLRAKIAGYKEDIIREQRRLGEAPATDPYSLDMFTGAWVISLITSAGREQPVATYWDEDVARRALAAYQSNTAYSDIGTTFSLTREFLTQEVEPEFSEEEINSYYVIDHDADDDVVGGPYSSEDEAERDMEDYLRSHREKAYDNFVDGDMIWALEQAEQDLWDDYLHGNGNHRVAYSEWTTKGGKDYQAVRLSLPPRNRVTATPEVEHVPNHAIGSQYVLVDAITGQRAKSVSSNLYFATREEAEAAAEKGDAWFQLDEYGFRDNHFPENNILGWIRTKTYTDADGRKVLFIEEVQPQWQQKGLDRGFQKRVNQRVWRKIVQETKDAHDRYDALVAAADERLASWSADTGVPIDDNLRRMRSDEWVIAYRDDTANYIRAIARDSEVLKDVDLADEIAARIAAAKIQEETRLDATRYRVTQKVGDYVVVRGDYRTMDMANDEKGYLDRQGYEVSITEINSGIQVEVYPPTGVDLGAALDAADADVQRAQQAMEDARSPAGAVADMPFKQTPAAAGLFMKWAIRYAVENDFDAVAWTTGAQQAKRYNQLVDHIDELRWQPDPNDPEAGRLAAIQRGNIRRWITVGKGLPGAAHASATSDGTLDELVGKELADRLRAAPTKDEEFYGVDGYQSVSGVNLEFGGEGMKGFYDKILVNITNDLIKKSGQRVKSLGLGIEKSGAFSGIRPARTMWEVVAPDGVVTYRSIERDTAQWNADQSNAENGNDYGAAYTVREAHDDMDAGEAQPSFDINDELRSIAMGGFPYLQADGSTKMGSTVFDRWGSSNSGELRAAVIRLFEAQNLSTLLHESGHVFLEIFQTIANDKDVPPELRAMWASTMAWMGKEPGEALTREDHELWARTFEAYLKEGKAPSLALRDVFRIFQSWLLNVYRQVKGMLVGRDGRVYGDVKLSPEITEVFDRLLASEEELAVARDFMEADRPFFQTREESGMSEAAWADYVKSIDDARIETETALRVKAMDKYTRKERREWRVMRESFRATATRDVDTDMARRAYEWLADGTWRPLPPEKDEDGNDIPPDPAYDKPADLPDMRLDTKEVATVYGDEALANLPRALKPATEEDVDALLADAQAVKRSGKVRKALRLSAWVRKRGGVKDVGGDIAAAIGGAKTRPGVINNATGKDLDDLAVAAWEDGFFGPKPGKASADPDETGGSTPGELFQMAGPKSKLVDKKVLKHAKRMHRKKKANSEIWAETAAMNQPWYRNENGEWVTEFEDGAIRVVVDGSGKLEEYIDYESATSHYPQLKRYGVKVQTPKKIKDRALGRFIPFLKKIEVNAPKPIRESTVAHETLHAIDDIEGRKYGLGMRYGLRPGERRAFNVEFRRRWTMAQRIAMPPWVTEEDAVNWALGGRTDDKQAVAAVEEKYKGLPLPREEVKPPQRRAEPYQPRREEELPKIFNEDHEEETRLSVPGRVFLSRAEIANARKKDDTLPVVTDETEIDFDKKLSEQNPVVADKLRKLLKEHNAFGIYNKRGRSIYIRGEQRRYVGGYTPPYEPKLVSHNSSERSRQAIALEGAIMRAVQNWEDDAYDIGYRVAYAKAEGLTKEAFAEQEIEEITSRAWGHEELEDGTSVSLMPEENKESIRKIVDLAWDRVSIDHETAYGSSVFDSLANELGTLGAIQALADEGIVAGRFRSQGTDVGQSVVVFGQEFTGHDAARTRWGWFMSLAGAEDGATVSGGAARFGTDEEIASLVDLVMAGASAKQVFDHPVYQRIVAHDEAAVSTLPADFTEEQLAARVYVEGRNAAQVIDTAKRAFEQAAGGMTAYDRKATLVFGIPGAGKSTFSKSIAATRQAALVDSDVILEQIPEYENGYNSSAVRREASFLRDVALAEMIASGQNLVIERIGDTDEQALGHIQELRAAGYQIEVVHVAIGQDEAVRRGALRFVETGRYVLPRVYDKAGDNTGKVFSRTIENIPLDGYIEINAETPRNQAQVIRSQGSQDLLAGLAPRLASPAGSPGARTRGRGPAAPDELFQSADDGLRPAGALFRQIVGGDNRGGTAESGSARQPAPKLEPISRPPTQADGTVVLTHYSVRPDLTQTDPAYHGAGLSRRSADNQRGAIPRTYFGIGVGMPGGYVKEYGLGEHVYQTQVPLSRLYDAKADPDGIVRAVNEEFAGQPGPVRFTEWEKRIKAAGYMGYWVNMQAIQPSMGIVAAVFRAIPVARIGDVQELYQSSSLPLMSDEQRKQLEAEGFDTSRIFWRVSNVSDGPIRVSTRGLMGNGVYVWTKRTAVNKIKNNTRLNAVVVRGELPIIATQQEAKQAIANGAAGYILDDTYKMPMAVIVDPENIRVVASVGSDGVDELYQDQRRPSLEEFRDALIADLRNERAVYSSDDDAAIEEQERLQALRRWFEARGVNLQADKDDLRRQIEAVVQREKNNPLATPPDIAAQWFGFEDGEALLKAVSGLPSRERAIEERMTAMVEAEIGDPFSDGRIVEEARLAAHLEVQARRLEIELAALQQATGGRAKPVAQAAKAFAERQIGMMTVKQVRGYDAFLAAERRSAKAAQERFRAGDLDGAALMKQRQLVNFHMYRLARQAAEEMDRTQDYFKKFDRPTIRAKIATPHLDQIDQALESIDIRKSPPFSERRRQGFLAWVQSMKDAGREHEIDVDPQFMEQISRRPFNTLTLLEARGLRDAIKNFEHIGKRFNEVMVARRKREYNELVRELVTAIDKNDPIIKDQIKGESESFFEKMNDLRLKAHAEHTKMEFLFRLLDGLKDNGIVWRTLFFPLARAEDEEQVMRNASAERIGAIFGVYTNSERAAMFGKRVLVNEVATRMTKAEMLAVALNWGNEGNRLALLEGHGWNPSQVEAVLSRLDKRDWDTVQAIWDWIGEYKPASFALQERLTGVRPAEVEPLPVSTKFGVYRGGYYPLRYDPRRSEKTFKREEKVKTLEEFGSNWIKPQTKKGHLIERTKSGGQRVRLDMGVLTEHVENVIHDITHREAIITTLRLIEDPRLAEAIKGVVGVQMYRVIRPWLSHIAADQRQPAGAIERIFLRARMGAQVVNMGWKITTAIVQPLGLLNSVPRVGAAEIATEATKFLGNPFAMKNAIDFIFARSTMMKNRMDTFDRDVREALARLRGRAEGDVVPVGIRQSMFWLTGVLDMSVAAPTWLAAYKKAMKGKVDNIKADDEQAAIAHADSIVRMTQGAGGVKDLAEITGRSSQLMKLFTMFYSYMSNLYNQLYVEQAPGVRGKQISKAAFIGNLFFLWLAPAYVAMLLQGRGDKDDDETVEEMLWRQGKEVGAYPLQTIVGVRDVVAATSSGYGYEISPVTDVGVTTVGALSKAGEAAFEGVTGEDGGVDEHELRALMKDTTMATSYWLGAPGRQLWTSGSYTSDVLTGREETPWEDPEAFWNEGLLRDANDPTR